MLAQNDLCTLHKHAGQFQSRASPGQTPGHLNKWSNIGSRNETLRPDNRLRAVTIFSSWVHRAAEKTSRTLARGNLVFLAQVSTRRRSRLLFRGSTNSRGKIGTACSLPDKVKANGFIVFVGLLLAINALLIPKWRCLKPLTSERRRKWRQDVTKHVFLLFAEIPGDGTLF